MSILINEILSYSRLPTQHEPFTSVDLNLLIDDALADLQVLVEEAEGRVELSSLPTIQADPIRMRQLFQNIIGPP